MPLTAVKKGRLVYVRGVRGFFGTKPYLVAEVRYVVLNGETSVTYYRLERADHLHPKGSKRGKFGWYRAFDLKVVQPEEGGVR